MFLKTQKHNRVFVFIMSRNSFLLHNKDIELWLEEDDLDIFSDEEKENDISEQH